MNGIFDESGCGQIIELDADDDISASKKKWSKWSIFRVKNDRHWNALE